MHTGVIKVLLVEDDEDDYIITRDLFSELHGRRFALDWAKTFETGLELIGFGPGTISRHTRVRTASSGPSPLSTVVVSARRSSLAGAPTQAPGSS